MNILWGRNHGTLFSFAIFSPVPLFRFYENLVISNLKDMFTNLFSNGIEKTLLETESLKSLTLSIFLSTQCFFFLL